MEDQTSVTGCTTPSSSAFVLAIVLSALADAYDLSLETVLEIERLSAMVDGDVTSPWEQLQPDSPAYEAGFRWILKADGRLVNESDGMDVVPPPQHPRSTVPRKRARGFFA